MKKVWRDFGLLALGTMAFILPTLGWIIVAGAAGTIESLDAAASFERPFFSPHDFTCEWVAPDGTEAVFVTEGGKRRLIDVSRERSTIVVGKRYRYRPGISPGPRVPSSHPYLSPI